jgi:lipoyl-dependent peroxiredoxin
MAARKGSAEWKGGVKSGAGTVRVGDGVFEGNYSFASRFEEGEGTNPEELIAAAHAACFAMALSSGLEKGGNPPDSIKAEAGVQLRFVDGAPTIAQIDLDVVGSVPGLDQDGFQAAAAEAKAACPVSRALAGVPEINLTARLEG